MAIIYAFLATCNWLAPSAVAVLGPRGAMITGGIFYSTFIGQFLYPNDYLLYGSSALLGLGAALLWTGQGNFITRNSNDATMSRNSGVFWAMLQCSMLIGNTFVYVEFRGLEDIDKDTRNLVVGVLLVVCCLGIATLLLLRPVPLTELVEPDLSAGNNLNFNSRV